MYRSLRSGCAVVALRMRAIVVMQNFLSVLRLLSPRKSQNVAAKTFISTTGLFFRKIGSFNAVEVGSPHPSPRGLGTENLHAENSNNFKRSYKYKTVRSIASQTLCTALKNRQIRLPTRQYVGIRKCLRPLHTHIGAEGHRHAIARALAFRTLRGSPTQWQELPRLVYSMPGASVVSTVAVGSSSFRSLAAFSTTERSTLPSRASPSSTATTTDSASVLK